MSSPTVAQIATALQTALETISGLRTAPYLSDNVTPPVALVAIETVEHHGAFGGGDVQHDFTVFVIASRASERAGIEALEGYMSQAGTTSIRAAIEADVTLGGVVSSAWVKKAGPPKSISIGSTGVVYLACEFAVEVHA